MDKKTPISTENLWLPGLVCQGKNGLNILKTGKINLEHLKMETDVEEIVASIAEEILEELYIDKPVISRLKAWSAIYLPDFPEPSKDPDPRPRFFPTP